MLFSERAGVHPADQFRSGRDSTSPQLRKREDRASIVTAVILRTIQETLTAWLYDGPTDVMAARATIESVLEDEFAAVALDAISETHSDDWDDRTDDPDADDLPFFEEPQGGSP